MAERRVVEFRRVAERRECDCVMTALTAFLDMAFATLLCAFTQPTFTDVVAQSVHHLHYRVHESGRVLRHRCAMPITCIFVLCSNAYDEYVR